MSPRPADFEPLRQVLAAADEPLTAREVLRRLEPRGEAEAFGTAHRVATVLGRAADADGPVEVTEGSPYAYRLRE